MLFSALSLQSSVAAALHWLVKLFFFFLVVIVEPVRRVFVLSWRGIHSARPAGAMQQRVNSIKNSDLRNIFKMRVNS